LVWREGQTVDVRSRCSIDDVGGVAVERVGGGGEGIAEVIDLARLFFGEGGSLETGRKIADTSLIIE